MVSYAHDFKVETYDRSDTGAEEGRYSEQRHRRSSLSSIEHIGNNTTLESARASVTGCENMDSPSGSQARSSECTSEKSQHDEHLETLGTATCGVECGERRKCGTEHDTSTEDLGTWCPDEWTDDKAKYEAGGDCRLASGRYK
jgi:hypothetical protein